MSPAASWCGRAQNESRGGGGGARGRGAYPALVPPVVWLPPRGCAPGKAGRGEHGRLWEMAVVARVTIPPHPPPSPPRFRADLLGPHLVAGRCPWGGEDGGGRGGGREGRKRSQSKGGDSWGGGGGGGGAGKCSMSTTLHGATTVRVRRRRAQLALPAHWLLCL